MDALTYKNMKDIILGNEIPVIDIDHTAVAYIRELLTPYAEAVEKATSIESVRAWVKQVYPADMAEDLDGEWLEDAVSVSDAVRHAIDWLVDRLLGLGAYSVNGIILPWDIKHGIQKVRAIPGTMADLVPVTDDDTLPVTIRLNGQDYLHNLSQDFVAGLQDYYRIAGGTIEVFVVGTPLTTNYLTDVHSHYDELETQYHRDRGHIPYRVTLIHPESERYFASVDYIRGATTAALWLGEDVHTRVANLRYTDASNKTHPLSF